MALPMPDPTNTRLKYGLAGCLIIALVAACLLVGLCAAGGWIWQTTARPTPLLLHTPTLVIPPTITPDPDPTARHLRIFDELWETVRDDYLYPDYNGADWDALGQEYRAHVEAGLSDEEFWLAMDEMLLELDDDHSIFLSPAAAAEEDRTLSGDMDYVGIGVYTTVPFEPEKEYVVVLLVLPDSPAARAGVRPHDHILTVNGHPACCDLYGYDYLERLDGPEGSQVELEVQTPGEPPRTVKMTRTLVRVTMPVEARLLEGNIGYILIPTLWDETIVERVRQALQELTSEEELAGLILDNRINPGGSDTVLEGLLEFFTQGQVGHFRGRWGQEPLRVRGTDIGGSQHIPLAILVGRETASFAEILSGALREAGRAQIVGRTTLGNVEVLYGYDFEDGSRAWIAAETFVPPSGVDWEETGIIPDVEIPLDWDEFTVEDDPQLEAALDLLRP
jgi:carboxyl-terminal processing protease